jgi:phosphatidylserine/phosphatidylglycerophosphate/cardiolipin synthase-like enzyme
MLRRVSARPPALPRDPQALRVLADQAFSRTAGAPLVTGNSVRILRDATENYPAWEAAIGAARVSVHVEMYIFHLDRTGRHFVQLLAARAREGVAVRVVYDWFGCGTGPLRGLFGPLLDAGGEVRAFNPPTLRNALGWLRRDHRKLITVDGQVAFVGGLCIGRVWEGQPERGLEPWRDTGIEIRGPAVAHAEAAFAESWRLAGGSAAECLATLDVSAAPAGSVHLRLIPTEPFTGNLLRLDLFVASLARQRLWITDAYFIGTGPYLEALRRAAHDAVDVRLLLPKSSDVSWTVPISRSLYRPLLEAGVRIFEWNGTMMHAKTAVADSRWGRIGSTNLNLNSWIGNWEMDVASEDDTVARTLEAHFEEDMTRSTEIVLDTMRESRRPAETRAAVAALRRHRTTRHLVRTVTGVGRSLGAAVTGNRPLEDFEATPLIAAGTLLTALAAVGFLVPWVLAWPAAALAIWMAVTFFVEAWQVRRRKP